MKKIFSLVLICLGCFSIIGCDNTKSFEENNFNKKNKITCTKTEKQDDNEIVEEKFTVTFKNSKLKYLVGENSITYADNETATSVYSFIGTTEANLRSLGFKVSSKLEDTKIIIIYEGNMEEISKNTTTSLSDVLDYDENTDQEAFLKEMKDDDYTCK